MNSYNILSLGFLKFPKLYLPSYPQQTVFVNNLICTEESPIASFSQSDFIISSINPTVNFNNSSIGAVDYRWNFGDNTPLSTLVSPSHNYPENFIGNYMIELIAYSEFGCTDTAYSFIQINEELIFYLPNTFTPDGDMFNQTFLLNLLTYYFANLS